MSRRELGVTKAIARSNTPVRADWLSVAMFLVHAGIVGYVVSGWTAQTREGLLLYVVLLPMIVMQWLLNGGSSIVSNIESLKRSGHWRDERDGLEGAFFQSVLKSVGIDASKAQINTVVIVTMFLFWVVAFFRMMLIAGT
jgi:hypothetical protein